MHQDDPPGAASDDDLVAQVAAGEAEAFAALFRRRQAVVYRFALHMTGAGTVAEDITQDVFLTLMRDAHRFEPGRATVTAWLCGIARNLARRRLEQDRRTVPLEDETDDEAHPDAATALDRLTLAEGVDALRKAILTLPLPYRETVVLCDLQELSYADAADALGCAVGTVRSRLHRGRALLAAKLRGAAQPEGGHAALSKQAEPPKGSVLWGVEVPGWELSGKSHKS